MCVHRVAQCATLMWSLRSETQLRVRVSRVFREFFFCFFFEELFMKQNEKKKRINFFFFSIKKYKVKVFFPTITKLLPGSFIWHFCVVPPKKDWDWFNLPSQADNEATFKLCTLIFDFDWPENSGERRTSEKFDFWLDYFFFWSLSCCPLSSVQCSSYIVQTVPYKRGG